MLEAEASCRSLVKFESRIARLSFGYPVHDMKFVFFTFVPQEHCLERKPYSDVESLIEHEAQLEA